MKNKSNRKLVIKPELYEISKGEIFGAEEEGSFVVVYPLLYFENGVTLLYSLPDKSGGCCGCFHLGRQKGKWTGSPFIRAFNDEDMYVNKQNEWHTALVSGFEFEKPSKNNEEIQKAICLLKKAGFTVED